MKIVTAATNIQIGETVYPLNSLFFKSDGTTVSIYQIGVTGAIASDIFSNFTDSNNAPFASADAVITALKTSLVIP